METLSKRKEQKVEDNNIEETVNEKPTSENETREAKQESLSDEAKAEQAAKAAAELSGELEEETKDFSSNPKDAEEASDESSEDEKPEDSEEKKKDPKDIKIAELEDRLMRTAAEFDNFRKRSEKEKASMYDLGVRSTIERLLPTIDNFERGLSNIPEDKEKESFYEGMRMIYKQLVKQLEELGITAIECVGKEFDPNLHNAVMHIDDDSYGENIVAEELQKGYMYKDMVVRHSMVKVAN